MHVAYLVAPDLEGDDHTKDIDFTPDGVRARREGGHADARSMLARAPSGSSVRNPAPSRLWVSSSAPTAVGQLATLSRAGSGSGAGPRSCRRTYAIDGKSV